MKKTTNTTNTTATKTTNKEVVAMTTPITVVELLKAVEEKVCVLANFTGTPIANPTAWYDRTRKVTNVTVVRYNGNKAKLLTSLIDATVGKGEYANMAIVITSKGNHKRPVDVFNFDIKVEDTKETELKELIDFNAMKEELAELLGKELVEEETRKAWNNRFIGGVKANIEDLFVNMFADELAEKLAKEDATLKMAQKERAFRDLRKSIYNEATGEFIAFDMQADPDETKNWVFTEEKVKMALSEFLRAIIREYDLDYVMTRNLVKHYKFDSIVQLNFEGGFEQAKNFKQIFLTPSGKFYVKLDCLRQDADEELGDEDTIYVGYRELTSLNVITELPENSFEFINVAHGASGIRKNSSFYLLNDGKIENVLDRASRGIYKAFKGKMLNISATVKANTRIMASAAPSRIMHKIDAFAIIVDKMGKGDKDNSYGIDKFKGLKGTLDGIAYSLFYAMQARLGSSKIFASQVTKRLMQIIIRFFDTNPIILDVAEEATQEQKDIISAVFGNKKALVNGVMTDLSGRVIICRKAGTDIVTPEYLTDLNGYKADFDITRGFEVPVLDMPIKNNAHSSTQFLSKVLAAGGTKAVKLIEDRLKKYFDELLENFTADSEISIKDLKDPFVAGIVGKAVPEYMKIDVSVRRQNLSLLLNSISKALNKMRFPIVESANGRAIPDIAAIFGIQLIKDDEFYTVDVKAGKECIIIKYPTIGEKEFWKCTRLSFKELCERINALEIPEELKGFGNDFKTELKNYYRNMAPGCAVMPADKAIMAGLAGMDFDYDMIIAIYDKDFVNIFKDVKPGVIHIMNPSDDFSEERQFGFMTMSDPQLALISKEAANVGGVTNNYNIPLQFDLYCRYYRECTQRIEKQIAKAQENQEDVTELSTQLAKRLKNEGVLVKTFKTILDYSFLTQEQVTNVLKGRKNCEFPRYWFDGKAPSLATCQIKFSLTTSRENGEAYLPIGENWSDPMYGYLPVSKSDKEAAETRMRSCRIETLEDIKVICADINRIARSDQETTIDSAKTSIAANIQMNFNKTTNVFSKASYEYTIDRDTNRIYRDVCRPNNTPGSLGKKFYIYDVFSMIRDNVECYIIPKVQEVMNTFCSSEEEINELIGSYRGVPGVAACIDMANLYGRISYNNVEHQGCLTKEQSDKYYKAIHNVVKMAADPSLKKTNNGFGKFVYWLSMYGNGSNGEIAKKANKTSFNSKCFPIETLYFAYKKSDKLARVCEPVSVIENAIRENQVLEFINGDAYNEEGRLVAVAKEFLNGEFKMMKVNGKFFACDKVSNYLKADDYDKTFVAFSLEGTHDVSGAITFNADKQGAYSSRGNAKVVINGKVYSSYMYEAIKVLKAQGIALEVEHSYVIHKDGNSTTIVLARVNGAVETEVNDYVEEYAYDECYAQTDEEKAETMSFNPMDYGFDASDIDSTPNFDETIDIEF